MGRVLKIILVMFIFLPLTGCTKKIDYEVLFDSVFELKAETEGKYNSVGTAFMFMDKVITNAHLITYKEYGITKEHEKISVKLYGKNKIIELRVVYIDSENDIAILKMIDFEGIKIKSFSHHSKVKIGDEIYLISNLNGYGLAMNQGIIASRLKEINDEQTSNGFIQTSIEISKGSSGAPVINQDGRVVGIMAFKLRDSLGEYVDGASFYIPISKAVDIILNNSVSL